MFVIDNVSAVISVYGGALPIAFLMAITFAIFGIFVVLKRMVFIGVTLSEVAACGVAFALIHELPPFMGAALFCLVVVAILAYPYELSKLPRDTVLGTIFIFASGMAILLVAGSGFGLEKVKAILYGNLLFASTGDVATICAVMIPALLALLIFFRPILYSFLDRESALSLGINVWRYELLFFIFLGLTVAAASRIAGVMLVFCYLVVPSATALLLSRNMVPGILLACFFALFTTMLGVMTSYQADLPPNQLIAVISCCFFVFAMIHNHIRNRWSQARAAIVSVTLSLLLVWGLSTLTVTGETASPALPLASQPALSEISEPAASSSAQVLLTEENCELPHDWPTIVADVEKIATQSPAEAAEKAREALKLNPPLFFAEHLNEIIAQHAE
ncbi:MAG: metal ABC transporter permease [Candidatus Riflebacteria bacterium]|nr:metal ABC transporter permease [Candidatus Riflebacteria bacterium]